MLNKMHFTATPILRDDCSQSLTSTRHHIMFPTQSSSSSRYTLTESMPNSRYSQQSLQSKFPLHLLPDQFHAENLTRLHAKMV